MDLRGYDHPTWVTALGTGASYGVVLAAMFLLLFVVPLLVFLALG